MVAVQHAERKPAAREALSAPEREVLRLIITEGQTNRQIAQRLRYSVGTAVRLSLVD